MAKVNVQKLAQTGVVFGILALAISWLYSIVSPKGIANISFAFADIDVASALQSGVDTSLAARILSPLSGILPQTGVFMSLLGVGVAGLIVIVVGGYLYELIPYRAKSKQMKLMAFALYGSVAVGAVLAFMAGTITSMISWGYLQVIAGTAIAFLIVALVYVFVANRFMPKIAIIPE